MEARPLVVIVGPTASGKTALSIKVAKRYRGEIISADSKAIYKGMDIGAAKPAMNARDGVPHWGFDLVKPGERFTAADFKQYANKKIAEIRRRGHVPVLAGGTGLYVDAVLFDYDFPPESSSEQREQLEQWSLGGLHKYCADNNITLPENSLNKRYVINTILRNGYVLKRRSMPVENTIIVGITTDRDSLRARIVGRTEQLFINGVDDEAKGLAAQYGWESEAMKGNIYPLLRRYHDNELSLDEVKQMSIVKDWRLAKRQLAWFKRNEHINWLPLDEAYTYIAHALDNLNNS